MLLKKKLQKNSRLYLILDTQVHDYPQLLNIAKKAILAGVDIIQLRDKYGTAKNIMQFSKKILNITKRQIPYIINDRVDLAITCQADGVHLGQEDLPLSEARKMLKKKMIVGVSCQTFNQAKQAQEQGADYIGFGSVFKTLTKPDREVMNLNLLERIVRTINIPVFAIGGIDLNNISIIKSRGVKRVAICRAISQAENIGDVTKRFQKVLKGKDS